MSKIIKIQQRLLELQREMSGVFFETVYMYLCIISDKWEIVNVKTLPVTVTLCSLIAGPVFNDSQ